MSENIEGIYAGYMTGAEGHGFSMFVFYEGVITGVDPRGVTFDGLYRNDDVGFLAEVKVTVPSGGTVIQGASAGPAGMSYEVQLNLPPDFANKDYTRIDTPLGAVNLRLRKLRSMENAS